jgi:hypothetical protein
MAQAKLLTQQQSMQQLLITKGLLHYLLKRTVAHTIWYFLVRQLLLIASTNNAHAKLLIQ